MHNNMEQQNFYGENNLGVKKLRSKQESLQSQDGCCLYTPSKNLNQSNLRREKSKQLIYEHREDQIIQDYDEVYSAVKVLIRLYTSDESEQEYIFQMLMRCRLNPNLNPEIKCRNDLEYYIPQLVNYLVFHEELKNQYLMSFLTQASQYDFFFAHLVYFQLNSLSALVLPKEEIKLEGVGEFLQEFVEIMNKTYFNTFLIAQKLLIERISFQTPGEEPDSDPKKKLNQGIGEYQKITVPYQSQSGVIETNQQISTYGTNYYDKTSFVVSGSSIPLKNYRSIFKNPFENNQNDHSFTSLIEFWDDLIIISENLSYAYPKIISLKADLQRINQQLPAAVYVPFLSNSIRNYVVLNISFEESRVFSTKMRAPFYICLEVFRPEDEKDESFLLDQKDSLGINYNKNDLRLSNAKILQRFSEKPNKMNKSGLNCISKFIKFFFTAMKQSENKFQNPQIRLTLQRMNEKTLHIIQEDPLRNSYYNDISLQKEQNSEPYLEGISCFYQKQDNFEQQDERIQNEKTIFKSFTQECSPQTQYFPLSDIQFSDQEQLNKKNLEKKPDFIEQKELGDQQVRFTKTESVSIERKLNESLIHEVDNIIIQSTKRRENLSPKNHQKMSLQLFGESEEKQKERIRKGTPYRNLKSWSLVHLIVKTGDNLKQEQFAMQLISSINQIFQEENLPMKLTTYDVLSMGPSCGIIQVQY